MTSSSFLLLGMFLATCCLFLVKQVFSKLQVSSHVFGLANEECPQTLHEAFTDTLRHSACIPPPTDHATPGLPPFSAAPALCLFAAEGSQTFALKLEVVNSNGRKLLCNYL